jgi:GR25 family glycosyltransferase involved in LPS biosynthesis
MIKILVIHNNERDRFAYLMPRLNDLIDGLRAAGTPASLQLVGPDVDLIAENRFDDNFLNRFRRLIEASTMFYFAAINDPRHISRKDRLLRYAANFSAHVISYRRSIRIEQEVLYAHAFCWRESIRLDRPAIVLESDALVNEHTLTGLLAVLNYLQSSCWAKTKYYVDLAGGCDRDRILGTWCFKNEYGCEDVEIITNKLKLILHKLPRLTTNTVGGYLISPRLANDLLTFVQNARPMLPPDWTISCFALRRRGDAGVLCIHTSPTLFAHGSATRTYRSTIDPTMSAVRP